MSVFHRNTGGRYADEVIIGGRVYSASKLRNKARRLTMRMWASVAITLLVAMTIVPYLAQAATNANNSNAFDGTVIPGYSMGGISTTAYGVDINSWGMGQSDTGKFAKSNYGIWSADRAKAASEQGSVITNKSDSDAETMVAETKSSGWKAITHKQNYTKTQPNGQTSSSTSTDVVNPYRTASDSTYWDNQAPDKSASTAGITVSWLPEFICVGMDSSGKPTVLTNPDDATSTAANQSMILTSDGNTKSSSAIPYYISLRDLFHAYGLNSSTVTMTDLMNEMKPQNKGTKPLKDLMQNQSNNLLYGTSYKDLNGSTGESSKAFNPYPYSMVFTKTDNGKQVVSGIYENDEAYVYFSPESMYKAYTTLASEYESMVSKNSSHLKDGNVILELGYYQAAMAICEAYLSEALPQDMTRGYVGPREDSNIAGTSSTSDPTNSAASGTTNGGNWRKASTHLDISNDISSPETSEAWKNYPYATIMYDVANQLIADGTNGSDYKLAETNATMDTLSTFGYAINDSGISTGVMKGMTAAETYNRMTAFTAYTDEQLSTNDLNTSKYMSKDKSALQAVENTGIYIAPYYPIQQHAIPSGEVNYRFSIVSDVPFQTMKAYLSAFGFGSSGQVKLSYSSGQFSSKKNNGKYSSLPTEADEKQLGKLLNMFQTDSADNDDSTNNSDEYKLNSTNYNPANSIVLSPKTATITDSDSDNSDSNDGNGEKSSNDSSSDDGNDETKVLSLQQRVDQALLNYSNSSMTADNVHDFCDVLRATCGLKYETFMRFYNPLKSSGSDPDIYLTRVSPANNSYVPTVLLTGYSSAGGTSSSYKANERTDTASYDYFSIPSLAPCLARHTSSDCYYGSLNYELRAFLQMGFLRTLYTGDGGMNIPAVTAMEQAKDAAQKLDKKELIDQQKMDSNLTTIFKSAQIMSAADASQTILKGNFALTVGDLRKYIKSALQTSGKSKSKSESAYADAKSAKYDADKWHGNHTTYKDYISSYNEHIFKYPDSTKIKHKDSQNLVAPKFSQAIFDGSDKNIDIFDYVSNLDSENGLLALDTVAINDETYFQGIAHNDQNLNDLINLTFSYLYRKNLIGYIGTDGDYRWCTIGQLKKKTNIWSLFDCPDMQTNASLLDFGKTSDKFLNRSSNDAKKDMDKAVGNLFQEVNNFYNTLDGLSSATPSQMQNAIAWADYANSSNSQNQYQNDPSQASTTVIVQGNSSKNKSKQQVTNVAIANSMQATYNVNGDGKLVGNTSTDSSMQAKTKRGVEDTTSTATGNQAAYTTTAVIARIRTMSQQSVTYPYSGLASSSLVEGADRYTQMQSHVVDYTDIANGLNDDLAKFQDTEAVTFDASDSSFSLLDFDVLAKIKEFLGGLAAGIVSLGGNFMKSQINPNSTSGGDTNFATVNAAPLNASLFSERNSYSAAVSASIPNATRTMIQPARYDGTQPTTSVATASADDNSSKSNASSGNIIGGNVGTASIHFILETDTGKNVYKFLQSLALLFVLVTLLIIAFQNMIIYRVGSSTSFIAAQTTLKTVLPRAVLAVFMIGLPPIGSGTGFQGGGFLLLEAVNSIMRQIGSVFSRMEGTGIIDMTIQAFKTAASNTNFFLEFLLLIFALLVCAMYFIGGGLVLLLNLFMFMFFILTPLAWATYVWPFPADVDEKDPSVSANVVQRLTRRLGSKTFTGSKVGSQAAAGFVGTFVDAELIYVIYVLLLWFVSLIFVGTTGTEWLTSTNSVSSGDSVDLGSIAWLTILNGAVIYMMYKLLWSEFKNAPAAAFVRGTVNGIANGVRGVSKVGKMVGATKAGAAAGAAAKAADAAGTLANAAGNLNTAPVDTSSALNATDRANDLANDMAKKAGDLGVLADDKAKKPDAASALDGNGAGKKALPTSESGAVLVHEESNDEKAKAPGELLKDSLKEAGAGILDGDSDKVKASLGVMHAAVGTAALNGAAGIGYGVARNGIHPANSLNNVRYSLGAMKDGVADSVANKIGEVSALHAASKKYVNKEQRKAVKQGIKDAYSQLGSGNFATQGQINDSLSAAQAELDSALEQKNKLESDIRDTKAMHFDVNGLNASLAKKYNGNRITIDNGDGTQTTVNRYKHNRASGGETKEWAELRQHDIDEHVNKQAKALDAVNKQVAINQNRVESLQSLQKAAATNDVHVRQQLGADGKLIKGNSNSMDGADRVLYGQGFDTATANMTVHAQKHGRPKTYKIGDKKGQEKHRKDGTVKQHGQTMTQRNEHKAARAAYKQEKRDALSDIVEQNNNAMLDAAGKAQKEHRQEDTYTPLKKQQRQQRRNASSQARQPQLQGKGNRNRTQNANDDAYYDESNLPDNDDSKH